jgi:hypothetical protein
MTIQSAAGGTYSVSAATPATYDQAGFEALSWTPVSEVNDGGSYGSSYNVIEAQNLTTRDIAKLKGLRNNGSRTMLLNQDPSDAGQTLIDSGVDGANENVIYSHKYEKQDGSIDYYTGQIYSNETGIGTADSVVSSTVLVEINAKVLRVAAP